jgi:F0F1-type ATP synthase assembly protein I
LLQPEEDPRNSVSWVKWIDLGARIAVSVAAPLLSGYALDRWLKTLPLFTLLGALLGIGAVGLIFYKLFMN